MEVLDARSCYTLYIENRKNLEVVRMNNQRPMFINILLVVLLFLVVGSLFSAVPVFLLLLSKSIYNIANTKHHKVKAN